MKEVSYSRPGMSVERSSFLSCLATVLELDPAELPHSGPEEHPARGWTISRWLGGRGLGLAPLEEPASFAWPGPWIARLSQPGDAASRYVVMFGVPSDVVWDPAGGSEEVNANTTVDEGFLVAAADIALAAPSLPTPPQQIGTVAGIWVASRAAEPARGLSNARALAGRGLAGDRHVHGTGTFPSGLPGSALTLIEAEVCESFEPPLGADEHRRNLVTRGIDLNRLVGHEFAIGAVRCRGMRLCEPCRIVQGYAARPVLRPLVHRGGLRADILTDGEIALGDEIRPV
jgi:hypothetical protein